MAYAKKIVAIALFAILAFFIFGIGLFLGQIASGAGIIGLIVFLVVVVIGAALQSGVDRLLGLPIKGIARMVRADKREPNTSQPTERSNLRKLKAGAVLVLACGFLWGFFRASGVAS